MTIKRYIREKWFIFHVYKDLREAALHGPIYFGDYGDDYEEINEGIQLYNAMHPKADNVDVTDWLNSAII